MISLLLELIDRLLDLRKYQSERLHKTVDDVLDPLYEDLKSVHGNYLGIFEDVEAQLAAIPDLSSEEGKKKLLEVAEALRRRRIEFEPVRQELSSMIRELSGGSGEPAPKMESPVAKEFVTRVLEYFPRGNLTTATTRSSALLMALIGKSAITPAQVNHCGQALPELVAATVKDCRDKWSAVCDSHARLKIAAGAS